MARSDKDREKANQQQMEAIARAQAGLPPKNAEQNPKPQALPISDRQAEENTAHEQEMAGRLAAQENEAALKTNVETPHPGVSTGVRGTQGTRGQQGGGRQGQSGGGAAKK